jgi:hypothetical protein
MPRRRAKSFFRANDINDLRRNQRHVSRAELVKYDGQYVAWCPDGTRILAADPDPLRLDALIHATGQDPAETLVRRIALPEDLSWGGWSLPDHAGQA